MLVITNFFESVRYPISLSSVYYLIIMHKERIWFAENWVKSNNFRKYEIHNKKLKPTFSTIYFLYKS